MIRVAVLGTGSMGRTHAQAYATIPTASVVAVYGRNAARARELAAPLGATAYTNVQALLDEARPDVVDCCLPTPLHRRAVEAAATHGCHAICEKPMALTLEDARAMIAASRAADRHLLMAQVVRFFPAYRRLAEAVAADQIGEPVTCTLLRQGFYPAGRDAWFQDETRSGGVMLDLMIHDFDWALHCFGPAERVFARLVQREGAQPFAQGMATVRHRSGTLTLATGTWGYPGPFTTMAEIAGGGGLLRFHTDETQPLRLLAVEASATEGDVALPDLSAGEDPFRTQLAHFVEVVEGHAAPLVQPEEALAALELALAARQSARSNRAITLSQEVHS